jgi:hypothetical protein
MAPRMARKLAPLALAAVLAGCAPTHAVGVHRTLYVALSEYRLRPQQVSARAGELTIFVRNYGRLTHDLSIYRGAKLVGATPPIWPGHNARLVVRLARGTYALTSSLFSDQALGMYGTLTVD